jgi:hypothetical protein
MGHFSEVISKMGGFLGNLKEVFHYRGTLKYVG